MTDKEKAIVMAHTGVCMLTGDKFQIFHKYVEDIMGRPIMTHEIGGLENKIKEKSKADFIALCANDNNSENSNRWISCNERMPEEWESVLVCFKTQGGMAQAVSERFDGDRWSALCGMKPIAWMPLPKPYKIESEDKE